jgi:hypothetical protein
MTTNLKAYQASEAARDALPILANAVEIKYRDGDTWKLEEEQEEHPVVARLRAASAMSTIEEPPALGPDGNPTDEILAAERQASQRQRMFIEKIHELCVQRGMPVATEGDNMVAWLGVKLAAP